MLLENGLLRIACLSIVLGWAGSSQAVFYSITGGGSQLQIGEGLPLPLQPATSTMGGALSMGGAIGTKMNFPPLLIPVNTDKAKALVQQTAGADPKKMTVPPGAFFRKASGAKSIGAAPFNPTVFQVQTNLAFSGPAPAFGSAVFSKLGRTGGANTTFTGVPKAPLPSQIRYTASANQFGGPSRTKVVPASVIQVWAHGPLAKPPCKSTFLGGASKDCTALMVEAFPNSLVVAGASVAAPNDVTKGGFVMTKGVRAVNVLTKGTIVSSLVIGMTAPISNMATSDGFPWTDGKIQLSQPAASGEAEVFTITGKDGRVGGAGTISLVAGALSNRTISGPNSNRSWAQFTLPEPTAVLGAAAALAMLGVCHGLVRRRSR